MTPECMTCGGPMPEDARPHARFCGKLCQKAAYRERAKVGDTDADDYQPRQLREWPAWMQSLKPFRNKEREAEASPPSQRRAAV